MVIPNYQLIMAPLMKIISDGNEHGLRSILDRLAVYFELTDTEINELLPSGQKSIFYDRVTWAKTYLKNAQLLEYTARSRFKITERGQEFIKRYPDHITNKSLEEFPEFLAFKNRKLTGSSDRSKINTSSEISEPTYDTPQEILEKAYAQIKTDLIEELITKIKNCSPDFLEKLVVDLLVKMGYGGFSQDSGTMTKKSRDGGIDGIIKEDKLGLDIVYIQAKKWENSVGRPEIQKFVGALAGQGAKKGIFITTSNFTNDAQNYLPKNDTKIVLIDGRQLAEYMIDYNLGVSIREEYQIKSLDFNYFPDE